MLRKPEDVLGRSDLTNLEGLEHHRDYRLYLGVGRWSKIWAWACCNIGVAESGLALLKYSSWTAGPHHIRVLGQ